MRHPKNALHRFCCWSSLLLALLLAVPAVAQDDAEPPVRRGAEVIDVVTPYIFEGDLRLLPRARGWQPGDGIKEIPRRHFGELPTPITPDNPVLLERDPLLGVQEGAAKSRAQRAFGTADINVAGQGYTGVNPPDTVGEVGANYYIQMINGSGGGLYRIHDKATGAVVAGPTALDTLGSGNCGSGFGDPIVLYDELAGRWMMSEFAGSGNHLCVYVSQTGDPISGGWFAYDFTTPSFPDYPKYAVWPDAYYVGSNENSPAVYALERAAMLGGQAASMQRFTAPDLNGFGFQMITPSDLDGAAPPAGAPNYFLRHNDDEVHVQSNDPGQDFIEIFEFHVDFATPANSTFTGPTQVGIADIDSSLCGLTSFNCIEQPGTNTQLDPLREVVMWRSQYRNFGSHEVLVGNLATDVDGTDHAGVRWYELRKVGAGGWTLHQEGTYAPDADSRWMGAASMDSAGNIAIGYNVGSSATFPGLRYVGRLAGDALGTLTQGEHSLIEGSASNSSNRYGDYSSLNVDPVDGCTFWLTGEYNTANTWSTRIGAFRFDGCGGTCGNGVIEGGEVCDGSELGGATCADFGCTGGGTLACNSSCTGFDTSGCSDCPICDNNGTCDAGEDCVSCPSDCVSGTSSGAVCGNGVCEAGDGEDCLSCSADCNGTQNGKPSNRFCCGDGDGQNPVSCSDSRCGGSSACTDVPQVPASFCCGDFVCEGSESCSNCALDCSTGAEVCGNGLDDDCNGDVDCDDAVCSALPECDSGVCTLGQRGDPCSSGADCCSDRCKGNGTCK